MRVSRDEFGRHGLRKTVEYQAWKYVRKQVNAFPEFVDFYNEVGPRPSSKHVMKRIDPAKGWVPGNVRWTNRSKKCS